jgi:hypothetical protein
MSERVTELFEQFVEAYAAGDAPDPVALIDQAGEEGEVLAGMIAAYLATRAPRQVPEQEVAELAARPEIQAPAPWPELLPQLRERTHTTRSQLARRLAEALGVAGSEQQVAGYVHELEAGLLAPTRVQPAVVGALATILSVPRSLLEASRGLVAPPPAAAPAFLREAVTDPSAAMSMLADEAPADPRVVELFTGGGDGRA